MNDASKMCRNGNMYIMASLLSNNTYDSKTEIDSKNENKSDENLKPNEIPPLTKFVLYKFNCQWKKTMFRSKYE